MLALNHLGSGKVREIYEVDDDRLLIVASDRISAYDVVMGEEIPDKGKVLTGLSSHWFELLATPHHLISTDPRDVPGVGRDEADSLVGRMMLVKRCDVIPMECVIRGYLYGSSWREYRDGGGPTTEHLPAGLELAEELPEPIFTPATKAVSGHDENLTESEARELVGDTMYEELKKRSLAIYGAGATYAAQRGIILADTKFEFGLYGGEILLIDEVLTPDSSRYWPAGDWEPGSAVPSFDKQPLRDWLDDQPWDKTPPPPPLPQEVIKSTRDRYVEVFERLTRTSFSSYAGPA